jgi:hypothetical protein
VFSHHTSTAGMYSTEGARRTASRTTCPIAMQVRRKPSPCCAFLQQGHLDRSVFWRAKARAVKHGLQVQRVDGVLLKHVHHRRAQVMEVASAFHAKQQQPRTAGGRRGPRVSVFPKKCSAGCRTAVDIPFHGLARSDAANASGPAATEPTPMQPP